ncbi:MAG: TSUP family transporter [Desulfobacterales bacterium]
MLLLTIVLVPLSLFIGIAASAIGFTAWPLIVPILFIICGFDLYLTICSSLLVDCGNALVMTLIALKHRQLDISRGLLLSVFALIWITAGIALGTTFIPKNEDFFRGSAGFAAILIGIFFIAMGLKKNNRKAFNPGNHEMPSDASVPMAGKIRIRSLLIYPGVALMAFQVGLVGIGGGMGYAVFLMLCLSFPVLKATGTAMLMTFCSTLFAACGIYFQIPDGSLLLSKAYPLIALIVLMSMAGTFVGAKITYSLTERKINFLIGGIVILAGLIATAQKYLLRVIS